MNQKIMILSSGWHFYVDWTPIIIGTIVLLVVLYVLLFPLLIGKAARKRGRSGIIWFLIALLISPLLAILILLLLGETDAKRREKIIKEELLRNSLHGISHVSSNSSDNQRLQQLLKQSRQS